MSIQGIKTAAGYELQQVENWGGGVTQDPDPNTCEYMHFDLSTEQLGRTSRYNCWGFTFLPRRYWINSSNDVDRILQDNCIPVVDGALRPGDVIRYRDDYGITTHTGRVWQVDPSGRCIKVRSKWGGWAEYIHNPLDVPSTYGTNLAYFRQIAPLKGIGDLWIKDSPQDNGEQCNAYLWTSPYIMLDAPPLGSPDGQAIYGTQNHVWAMVENRSDTPVENVRLRYYWANPSVGFSSSSWNLIPNTTGYPNPTATFSVPAYSAVEAPHVVWIPSLSQAHQCLLAVAYINDDPKDSNNPDPLVYPFDIRWENNVAARNITVVTLKAGASAKFVLDVVNPFDHVEELQTTLRFRLVATPRLPILGFPQNVNAPAINLTLDGKKLEALVAKPLEFGVFGTTWGPYSVRPGVDFELVQRQPILLSELLRLREKTIAWREIPGVRVIKQQALKLEVQISAPADARPGSTFNVHVEQEVDGNVTGGYTFVVTIEN